MAIRVECPSCKQAYNVGEDKAGRRFRCKKCSADVEIPELEDDFATEDLWGTSSEEVTQAAPPSIRAKKRNAAPKSPSVDLPLGLGWYVEAFKKYAVFQGRARRREYWFFGLYSTIAYLLLAILESIVRRGADPDELVLPAIYLFATIPPNLAVTVRRLHDTDRSGWWVLIGFLPVIGGLILLVFMLLDSDPGPNRYGQSPKR